MTNVVAFSVELDTDAIIKVTEDFKSLEILDPENVSLLCIETGGLLTRGRSSVVSASAMSAVCNLGHRAHTGHRHS